MNSYAVEVQYRTQSGCNSRIFRGIEAADIESAVERCVEAVKSQRGAIKIDGGSAAAEHVPAGGRLTIRKPVENGE